MRIFWCLAAVCIADYGIDHDHQGVRCRNVAERIIAVRACHAVGVDIEDPGLIPVRLQKTCGILVELSFRVRKNHAHRFSGFWIGRQAVHVLLDCVT